MKTTNDNLVGRAKLFLATQFDGHWDGEHLWIEDNEIHLAFDQGVAERNGELMLTDSGVAIPGEKLGHRVMVAVRSFSDLTGVPVLVGLAPTSSTGTPRTEPTRTATHGLSSRAASMATRSSAIDQVADSRKTAQQQGRYSSSS